MNPKEFWTPHCGAVSITFDDGTQNQLDEALPLLDKYNLKGTFYIMPSGRDWEANYLMWQKAAACGHEIGNHTRSHLCSKNILENSDGLEDKTLPEIEEDILTAQKRLVPIASHQKQWTFAYPCYNTDVGCCESRQSYVPIIAKHFLAGRAGGEYGFANNPARMDLACAAGLSTDRMSGFEMIGLVEELTARGRWAILVFHEINGARLTVGSHDFDMLLNYLNRRRESILTAPVVEIAGKVADYQARISSAALK